FRHMTVFDNVAFGLRMKPRRQRPSEAVIAGKVHELLGLVQLDWLADRYPEQLSGGQRQRIALARALAVGPRVLLLDEPFGALDAKVRKELRRWLARLHENVHLTSVFVTHDQEEAMEVADRIVVMNKGVIEQIGTPAEVYRNPASEFVYHFLGDANRLQLDDERSVLFRPHEVSLSRVASAEHLPGEVRDIRPLGAMTRVTLKVASQAAPSGVEAAQDQNSRLGATRGQTVHVRPAPRAGAEGGVRGWSARVRACISAFSWRERGRPCGRGDRTTARAQRAGSGAAGPAGRRSSG